MEINKDIRYTVKDVHEVFSQHMGGKRTFYFVYSWICIIGAIILMMGQYYEGSPIHMYILMLMVLAYGIYRLNWLNTLGKRVIKMNPAIMDDIKVQFSDDDLHFLTRLEDSRVKWEAFTNAKVNEKFIILYPNDNMFYFFPRRFFTESEYAELSRKASQFVKQKYRDS